VLWVNLQAQLPGALLSGARELPPRDLVEFALVALATYAPAGALLGLGIGGLLRRVVGEDAPAGVCALGAFGGAWALGCGGLSVWVHVLAPGPFAPRTLALHAVALLAITLGLWALCALLRRTASSAASVVLWVGVLVPGIFCAGAAVLHRAVPYPPVEARGTPREGLPNVVLVTLDTIRAERLGTYGGRASTPTLDRLAQEGVRFALAISQVPTTTPSHVSMFTSLYPFSHGAKNGLPIRPGLLTLPERLRELGYHTAAFTSAYTTKSNVTGLGDWFDTYVDSLNPWIPFLAADAVEPLAVYRLADRLTGNQIPAPLVNDRVFRWLRGPPPAPFFLWVHYFDAHAPFEPPDAWRDLYSRAGDTGAERALALYDAELSFVDAQLGELLEALRSSGALADALLVVVADHGEAFGEPTLHPEHGHGRTLYDSVLRVPLLFWGPGRVPAGALIEAQVETIDIAPTVLELLGGPVPEAFAGRSLAGLLRGRPAERVAERLAYSQTANHKRPRRYSVRSTDWKLHVNVDAAEEELYDLAEDPRELHNRIGDAPAVADRLRERLFTTMTVDGEADAEGALSEDAADRLRALGYLVD
jgi:arylsulfatase A-like enzyme